MPRLPTLALFLVAASARPALEAQQPSLPPKLSDREFWQMVTDFSEPVGYFRSDNFLSNESSFQDVIPRLREAVPPGGVYLGVGPEHNVTYIVALRPKIAFIFDIRSVPGPPAAVPEVPGAGRRRQRLDMPPVTRAQCGRPRIDITVA